MRHRAIIAALLATALFAAGCGDDGGDDAASEEAATEIPGGADPEEAQVINQWSTALREGDVESAADFFVLPSVAQNGTPAVKLETREDVIEFNRALPCGAELVRAETDGPYTVATFELTERPGEGECGPGVGSTAKTAFLIEDGKIARWLRAADDPVIEEPEEPVV